MPAAAETFLIGYLKQHGISDSRVLSEVRSGFDLTRPLYPQRLDAGEPLFQFVRLSSSTQLSPRRGRWYGLKGVTTASVAVLHGLAGRRLHEFRVRSPFMALEGTASELPVDWNHEIGGPGGGTQVFVPDMFAGCIEPVGPAE
jgi:hypothetical protein